MPRGTRLVTLFAVVGSAYVVGPMTGAAADAPAPTCTNGQCSISFGLTQTVQSFTVPSGVPQVRLTVAGGGGGGSNGVEDTDAFGGRTSATVAVTPGQVLSLVVGGRGGGRDQSVTPKEGAPGGYGGGGQGGEDGYRFGAGASGGGGGSFVFDGTGTLLAAAGGGGGTAWLGGSVGGAGGGAGAPASAGDNGSCASTGGGPGTLDGNGAGGQPTQPGFCTIGGGPTPSAGQPGTGSPDSPTTLPIGGKGGEGSDQAGGGGGGGYRAGGGGGGTSSVDNTVDGSGGGGGAGYAIATATDVSGAAGVNELDGSITIDYTLPPVAVVLTSSGPAGSPTFTATLSGAAADPTGTVQLSTDAGPLPGCSGPVPILGATATCTATSVPVAATRVLAVYSGDGVYLTSSGLLALPPAAGPVAVAPTAAPVAGSPQAGRAAPALASTGVDPTAPLGWSAALITLGAAAVVVGRRRST